MVNHISDQEDHDHMCDQCEDNEERSDELGDGEDRDGDEERPRELEADRKRLGEKIAAYRESIQPKGSEKARLDALLNKDPQYLWNLIRKREPSAGLSEGEESTLLAILWYRSDHAKRVLRRFDEALRWTRPNNTVHVLLEYSKKFQDIQANFILACHEVATKYEPLDNDAVLRLIFTIAGRLAEARGYRKGNQFIPEDITNIQPLINHIKENAHGIGKYFAADDIKDLNEAAVSYERKRQIVVKALNERLLRDISFIRELSKSSHSLTAYTLRQIAEILKMKGEYEDQSQENKSKVRRCIREMIFTLFADCMEPYNPVPVRIDDNINISVHQKAGDFRDELTDKVKHCIADILSVYLKKWSLLWFIEERAGGGKTPFSTLGETQGDSLGNRLKESFPKHPLLTCNETFDDPEELMRAVMTVLTEDPRFLQDEWRRFVETFKRILLEYGRRKCIGEFISACEAGERMSNTGSQQKKRFGLHLRDRSNREPDLKRYADILCSPMGLSGLLDEVGRALKEERIVLTDEEKKTFKRVKPRSGSDRSGREGGGE